MHINCRARLLLSFVFLSMCIALPLYAQRGAMTLPRNLGQLVDQSSVIVRGRVASVRVEQHPEHAGLWTVAVTLQVEETLKGKPDSTFSFRQFIWDIRDRQDASGYRRGQHLLLMMNAPTSYGLSSPAGLEQGRFRIVRNANGQEMAINGHGNAALFARIEETHISPRRIQLSPQLWNVVSGARAGPVRLDDMRELILRLAEAK